MKIEDGRAGTDPEERAFTGHSDHPPEQPDQGLEQNRELLRKPAEDPDESPDAPQAPLTPGA